MDQLNHPESEKSISTTVGVVILVLVAIIIGLVVWKSKGDTDSALNAPIVSPPVQIKKNTETATETHAADAVNEAVADKTPIDFDKELKDLDTAAGAVDSNDFGDTGLSNANLGL